MVEEDGIDGGRFKDKDEHAIILFDGVCSLCSRSVSFIISRDPAGYFSFASLQGEAGQALLQRLKLTGQPMDSIVLIEQGIPYVESTAALRISRHLTGLWKSAVILLLIPRPVRDILYRFIARNRYKWFGRQDRCMMPSAAIRDRFLE